MTNPTTTDHAAHPAEVRDTHRAALAPRPRRAGPRRGAARRGVTILAALAAALTFAGCSSSGATSAQSPSAASPATGSGPNATGSQQSTTGAQTVTITDMLGRKVTMPKTIHRILALHPIPTGLLSILAPQDQVSIDKVFQGSLKDDAAQYTPTEYKKLSALPVTGVYFMGLSIEQLLSLHPDVVITMVGDPNIDQEQKQTGIPFFAVSKEPTSSYETTIRLVGQIVGQQTRADQLADFWKQTIASVQKKTATVPASQRPTVLYTGKNGDLLGVPGKDTVFGSTMDTAGGRNVADSLPKADAANESAAVSIEQVVKWNPDVIIAADAAAKQQIMTSPQWHTLKAVQDGHVYAPRQFAGLDGLQAVLGMVWAQGVLLDGNDTAAQNTLTTVMQNYYKLFYGHTLTSQQIAEQSP